jgi:DNA invertase Pin-like site-specific DNA recombinase
MENTKTYIAYYRVSTKEQGKSGLGIAAQKEAVRRFTNCTDCIIGEYTETASGKNDSRPQLLEAIAHAKKEGAKLLIAKLDRLSRNAAFIFTLRDSHVDFVCCDMPDANTLTIGIFATLAQHERELISKRTKGALKEIIRRYLIEKNHNPEVYFNMDKKAKRVFRRNFPDWPLGTDNATDATRQKGAEAMKAKAAANQNNRRAADAASDKRAAGKSLQRIADELNAAGYKTPKGKAFQRVQVKRLLDKIAAA